MNRQLNVLIGFLLLASLICTPATAELVVTNVEGNLELSLTQTVLDDQWVQVLIAVKSDTPIGTIAGGFEVVGDTRFSQDPAGKPFLLGSSFDTAFLGEGPAGTQINFGSVDTVTELSTEFAGWFGEYWGSVDQWFPLAQLVVSVGGEVRLVERGGTGRGGLSLLADSGNDVAYITGSFSAVPEPGTLTLAAVGSLCCLGLIVARRQRSTKM